MRLGLGTERDVSASGTVLLPRGSLLAGLLEPLLGATELPTPGAARALSGDRVVCGLARRLPTLDGDVVLTAALGASRGWWCAGAWSAAGRTPMCAAVPPSARAVTTGRRDTCTSAALVASTALRVHNPSTTAACARCAR
ncbi:MAG: hypothetical protein R3F59_11965 [Myxococcota bacterium]